MQAREILLVVLSSFSGGCVTGGVVGGPAFSHSWDCKDPTNIATQRQECTPQDFVQLEQQSGTLDYGFTQVKFVYRFTKDRATNTCWFEMEQSKIYTESNSSTASGLRLIPCDDQSAMQAARLEARRKPAVTE